MADLETAEPIRLPLTIMESSAVTRILVGDREVIAGVDTGGGVITLSGDVIRNAGAKRMPGYNTGTDAFGQESRGPIFKVPTITIGGRTFRNVVVAQEDEPTPGEGPPVSSSIGREFLSRYFVVIDYANRSMTLWPPGSSAAADIDCGLRRLPMEPTRESGLVVTQFMTPSGPLRAIWDTGAQYSAMPEDLARDRNLALTLHDQTPFHQLGALTAAGQDFGPLEFVVLPVKPPEDFQVFLGANFFSNHVVCLDYKNREIRVR